MSTYREYPRTPHLPWSPCVQSDHVALDTTFFEGKEVVVLEKLGGENISMDPDHVHARSANPRPHPSRDYLKALHARIKGQIPQGWRLVGENTCALHSISSGDLEGSFCLCSIWNEQNVCLSWDEVKEWAALFELPTPRELYRGIWDEERIRAIPIDTEAREGYVVRTVEGFTYENFARQVAKWARGNRTMARLPALPVSSFSPTVLFAAGTLMFLMGVFTSGYGLILPRLQADLGFPPFALGWISSALTLGILAGAILSAWLMLWLSPRLRFVLGGLHMGLAALLAALAPNWGVFLSCMFGFGLAYGVFFANNASLINRVYGLRSAIPLNALGGCLGVGSVVGPLLMVRLGENYPWALTGIGILAIGAAALGRGVPAATPPAASTRAARGEGIAIRWSVALILLIVMSGLQLVVVDGVGFWSPTATQQISRLSPEQAAQFLAGFWALFTLGRFVASLASVYLNPPRLLLWALTGATTCLWLTSFPPLAPWAFGLAGFFAGPVVPTLTAWLGRLAAGERSYSAQQAGGEIGATLGVALLSWLVAQVGPGLISPFLASSSLLTLLLAVTLLFLSGRDERRFSP